MRKLPIAAVIAAAAATGLPATPASAAKHCHKGYVLKHGKCVKKSKSKPKPPTSRY